MRRNAREVALWLAERLRDVDVPDKLPRGLTHAVARRERPRDVGGVTKVVEVCDWEFGQHFSAAIVALWVAAVDLHARVSVPSLQIQDVNIHNMLAIQMMLATRIPSTDGLIVQALCHQCDATDS